MVGLIPFIAFLAITWRDLGRTRRAARVYAAHRDPELIELGYYATFLQISFFGILISHNFNPQSDMKSQFFVMALSTVVVTFASQRVEELQTKQHTVGKEPDPLSGAYEHGAKTGDVYAR